MTTTSLLQSQIPGPGNITQYDLDIIRDYAIKAPWEWRCALEALIEIAENERESDELLERIDELESILKEVVLRVGLQAGFLEARKEKDLSPVVEALKNAVVELQGALE